MPSPSTTASERGWKGLLRSWHGPCGRAAAYALPWPRLRPGCARPSASCWPTTLTTSRPSTPHDAESRTNCTTSERETPPADRQERAIEREGTNAFAPHGQRRRGRRRDDVRLCSKGTPL